MKFLLNWLEQIEARSALGRQAAARHEKINALNAKSDADLARLGLRRDQIAAFVFQDAAYA